LIIKEVKCTNGEDLRFEETPYYFKIIIGRKVWYWDRDTGKYDGTACQVEEMDKKEKGKMDKKMKDEPIERLEKEFNDFQKDFQKKWEKLVNNDLHHLNENVDKLTVDVNKLTGNMAILIGRSISTEDSLKELLNRGK